MHVLIRHPTWMFRASFPPTFKSITPPPKQYLIFVLVLEFQIYIQAPQTVINDVFLISAICSHIPTPLLHPHSSNPTSTPSNKASNKLNNLYSQLQTLPLPHHSTTSLPSSNRQAHQHPNRNRTNLQRHSSNSSSFASTTPATPFLSS